jgi:hypothetical protein
LLGLELTAVGTSVGVWTLAPGARSSQKCQLDCTCLPLLVVVAYFSSSVQSQRFPLPTTISEMENGSATAYIFFLLFIAAPPATVGETLCGPTVISRMVFFPLASEVTRVAGTRHHMGGAEYNQSVVGTCCCLIASTLLT